MTRSRRRPRPPAGRREEEIGEALRGGAPRHQRSTEVLERTRVWRRVPTLNRCKQRITSRPDSDRQRPHDRREQAVAMAEFQRARLLRAALVEVSERGFGDTPVARIIARAGVSRTTFYELFDNREDRFAAVFDESVAQLARAVALAYEEQRLTS